MLFRGFIWLACMGLTLPACAQRYSIPDKVVVMTGASGEVGKAIARALSAQGAHVVLPGQATRQVDGGENRHTALGMETAGDLTQDDVERLARTAVARFGRIDVWINGVGIAEFGRFEEIPLADHTHVVQTNLLGVIYGSHIAMSRFRMQGFGTLINIGSIAGKIGAPYYATYSATKFGVIGLGQALNQELRVNDMKDVHVSTIIPTATEAPLLERAANREPVSEDHSVDTAHTTDVVNAIIRAVIDPKQEIPVDFRTTSSMLFHRWAPDTAANFLGERIQDIQER